ncbi:PPOX class F420-dependent oxidoreductase [Actinomadura sp. KC06]|uniref:PPOX class F420-dependent oxidoreductase n=1 Tax=Actinomadura sp. KC06 TaxID=2530369 RepID=UPI00104E4F1E|nr:PPOX class F420-dependent oxidoreductase [Actinomadura sp. KC06]TDD34779.1 PPOX class F420-dependent oxidoreductase [Actinomadura sp. KC06]
MIRKWDVVYWFSERALHPSARRTTSPPTGTAPHDLRRHGTVLVVTFRATGEAVPTPLSCAVSNGRLYASTAADSGKVKRIHRNPKVLVAPSTVRGKPLAPHTAATARVLESHEAEHAERVLDGRYGALRRLYRKAVDAKTTDTAYLEITPTRPTGPGDDDR